MDRLRVLYMCRMWYLDRLQSVVVGKLSAGARGGRRGGGGGQQRQQREGRERACGDHRASDETGQRRARRSLRACAAPPGRPAGGRCSTYYLVVLP